jgi:predicted ATP-grasp superfamily ATP-dependent carboligase
MIETVVVTDGEQRAALAVVRSLGRAGYRVHVCSQRAASLAGSSRFCAASHRVPDPLTDSSGFVSALLRGTDATKADVLVPITEGALLAVLPNRERFNCAIPFPGASAFERICDKLQVLDAAKASNIAVPTQAELIDRQDLPRWKSRLQFPLVVKPSRSIAGKEGARIHTGVSYASNLPDLESVLQDVPAAAYPVLLQQKIDGPGFAISVLVWEGELIAAFAHRRIREKPPSGGVSVLRESIPLDHELLARSLDLLHGFGWQGVAMVEFKLDSGTGVPYLMEINGRLWGSLQLAIDAGVDFPRLLALLALGSRPAPVTTYESGMRLRWEWGDVDHLLACVRHSVRKNGLSNNDLGRRRIHAISQFLGSFRPSNRLEVFRLSDPGPFIRETKDWFRGR